MNNFKNNKKSIFLSSLIFLTFLSFFSLILFSGCSSNQNDLKISEKYIEVKVPVFCEPPVCVKPILFEYSINDSFENNAKKMVSNIEMNNIYINCLEKSNSICRNTNKNFTNTTNITTNTIKDTK